MYMSKEPYIHVKRAPIYMSKEPYIHVKRAICIMRAEGEGEVLWGGYD